MRVPNNRSSKHAMLHSEYEKNEISKLKYNTSFERNIERLRFQSETFGWSYSDFVANLLEVLLILRHRNSWKCSADRKEKLQNRLQTIGSSSAGGLRWCPKCLDRPASGGRALASRNTVKFPKE